MPSVFCFPSLKEGFSKNVSAARYGGRDLKKGRERGASAFFVCMGSGEGLFLIVVAVRLAIAIAVDVAETVTVVARGGAG